MSSYMDITKEQHYQIIYDHVQVAEFIEKYTPIQKNHGISFMIRTPKI